MHRVFLIVVHRRRRCCSGCCRRRRFDRRSVLDDAARHLAHRVAVERVGASMTPSLHQRSRRRRFVARQRSARRSCVRSAAAAIDVVVVRMVVVVVDVDIVVVVVVIARFRISERFRYWGRQVAIVNMSLLQLLLFRLLCTGVKSI
jgi:hypothetical protein